jgi:hypothetical protein
MTSFHAFHGVHRPFVLPGLGLVSVLKMALLGAWIFMLIKVSHGDHYRLPMISYRDPLWAEIQAGRMKWTDISPDVVHPNDRGHAYAARFATCLLDRALERLPASVSPDSFR